MNSPEEILAVEFSDDFLAKMKARVVMGFFRYGPARKASLYHDYLKSIRARLRKYEETGNTEWLVDVANLAMLEFRFPIHPDAHFRATEHSESPGMSKA